MRFHQDHLGEPGSWHFFKGQKGSWVVGGLPRRRDVCPFHSSKRRRPFRKKQIASLPGRRQDLMYGYLRCISAIYKLVEKPTYDEFTKDGHLQKIQQPSPDQTYTMKPHVTRCLHQPAGKLNFSSSKSTI